jgi:1-acyl-sn-glycerol-3-phosphate acyltransferase
MLGVRLHLHDREHVPAAGPCIVASNHVSYVDFAALQAARPPGRPPLRFLARWDLLPPWLAHPLMRRLGLLPVDERRRPGAAFPAALRVLEQGGAVGIHPEGRVRPDAVTARGRSGAVRLALASGVPLVPCSVWGTQRLLTRGRHVPDLRRPIDVHVRFGPPIEVRLPVAHGTRTLMSSITALTRRTLAHAEAVDPCVTA